jgi:hypothetical protein
MKYFDANCAKILRTCMLKTRKHRMKSNKTSINEEMYWIHGVKDWM